MKIVVCVRQGLDDQINPFDACAYEAALRLHYAEITLLSMGPPSARDFLLGLTRLGAKKAILLSDKMFAGADTLATAYTLSLAIRKLNPDLILCGRQTLIGDTGQTGPMLPVFTGRNLVSGVMHLEQREDKLLCTTRDGETIIPQFPALLTVERIYNLRLPSILSKLGQVEIWNGEDLGADPEKCGLQGSPTRVLKTFENKSGKRKCIFISWAELPDILAKASVKINAPVPGHEGLTSLRKNCIVEEIPRSFAETVTENITVLPFAPVEELAEMIQKKAPSAVLFGSDTLSKELAAKVSALMGLGLCADCTALEADGDNLVMYRPALSGSLIAKIISKTRPAMATVRTVGQSSDILVSAGWGAKDSLEAVQVFVEALQAEMVTSRKMVDNGILPYAMQVGLTGKTVNPAVYIAVGVSGAVHHIAGMQRAGTVIAINPDREAPIFEYADYGIVEAFSTQTWETVSPMFL